MDIEEIKARVEGIKNIASDYEGAHAVEDQLMYDFIKYVSENGEPLLAEMASEIMKTEQIEFPRYCA